MRVTIIAALAFVAGPALAQDINYNYIEGYYQRLDVDDSAGDIDGDGFGIAGSLEVGDSFHIFSSFGRANLDFDIDLDEVVIGGGYHTPVAPGMDLVINLSYINVDAEAFGLSGDDDGFGASLGLRSMWGEKLELAGFVDYIDLDESGDDTSFRGEAWYSLTRTIALGAQVGLGDDVTSWGLGARVYFD